MLMNIKNKIKRNNRKMNFFLSLLTFSLTYYFVFRVTKLNKIADYEKCNKMCDEKISNIINFAYELK